MESSLFTKHLVSWHNISVNVNIQKAWSAYLRPNHWTLWSHFQEWAPENFLKSWPRLSPEFVFHIGTTQQEVLCSDVFMTTQKALECSGEGGGGGCSRQRHDITCGDYYWLQHKVIFVYGTRRLSGVPCMSQSSLSYKELMLFSIV